MTVRVRAGGGRGGRGGARGAGAGPRVVEPKAAPDFERRSSSSSSCILCHGIEIVALVDNFRFFGETDTSCVLICAISLDRWFRSITIPSPSTQTTSV